MPTLIRGEDRAELAVCGVRVENGHCRKELVRFDSRGEQLTYIILLTSVLTEVSFVTVSRKQQREFDFLSATGQGPSMNDKFKQWAG